jgi:2-polyprenyl-6-hydroxyphenyl methylase/3-demethylubiquinone-9 3-methyltransferase
MSSNADPAELAHFNGLAHRWWDPAGDFGALHRINPLRMGYIQDRCGLAGQRVLDVGCGGGILSEALASAGAQVTGIDLAADALQVARMHLLESQLTVDYQCRDIEDLAAATPGAFDVVTCMELLEHVPDPARLVRACGLLVRPGGEVFMSTINRNAKSFLFAILGAEYVLRMVPRGTHSYERFIRPSELDSWGRSAGLTLGDVTGLTYNPMTDAFRLGHDVDVNYLTHFHAPAATP